MTTKTICLETFYRFINKCLTKYDILSNDLAFAFTEFISKYNIDNMGERDKHEDLIKVLLAVINENLFLDTSGYDVENIDSKLSNLPREQLESMIVSIYKEII